jgi:hypothetical protein
MEEADDEAALTGAGAGTFEHELRLVKGAIELVARGGAPRVTLVGLRAGDALLSQANALGRSAHLVLRSWPHPGPGSAQDDRFDLVVQHG